MNVACAVISDRGDLYLPGCLESLAQHAPTLQPFVIDDSAHRLGMAGAVRAAWSWALTGGADYLFHCEEDFRFHQAVPLDAMSKILEANPQLAQVVLKRQPWSDEEKRAGGQIEVAPDDYTDRAVGDLRWTEHRRLFSLNPSLIPRHVLELGWPDGNEAGFTALCHAMGFSFAYFGHRSDPPRCEHVGHQRGAGWRL